MTNALWLEVLGKLGGVAALLIIVAGAMWKAFEALSGKWLDHQFAEKLKAVEQKHDVMVRHLQSSIDREFDRAVKLHASEFDALSDGWSTLHEAYWHARDATGRGWAILNLGQMGPAQRNEFIDSLDFPNWQKQELRGIQDPGWAYQYYMEAWRAKQLADCASRRLDLIRFIDRKGIFMQPEIKQRFMTVHKLIDDAIVEFELRLRDINAPHNRFNEYVRSDALRDSEAEYNELERMIHARLWSSTVVEPKAA